ncbi:MAG: YggT family protein [Acidimicrobiia bacterium]
MNLLCIFLQLYFFVLLGRVVLSFFPISQGSPVATIASVLYQLTEPVLGPIRRIIPPLGMFDLSPLLLFFGIQLLRGYVCSL